jgi:hypothetical protein
MHYPIIGPNAEQLYVLHLPGQVWIYWQEAKSLHPDHGEEDFVRWQEGDWCQG